MFNGQNDNTFNSISYDDYFFSHSSIKEDEIKEDYDEIIPSHTATNQGWMNQQERSDFNDIDLFITQCQSEIKLLYFNSDFPLIQNKLESIFPHFFEIGNYSFLYFIRKLIFFKLLQLNNTFNINSFYFNELFPILKEVKPKEWKSKHKVFLQLTKTPSFFRQTDVLKKYYDQFQYELEKSIRDYLAVNLSKMPLMNKKPLKDEKIGYEADHNIISSNQQEITELSTKEEFSDFEDELENKDCNNDNDFNQNFNLDTCNVNTDFQKIIPKEIKNNQKKNRNINSFSTQIQLLNKPSNKSTLIQQLPFLNSFKPTYAKRETIDKKILRTFRKYVKEQYNNKNFCTEKQHDPNFWILFINGNILPPLNYYDNSSEELIHFKSFNSRFLLWFFSKDGIKDVYNSFIKHANGKILNKMIEFYQIKQKDRENLNSYIINLPFIFDISLVSKKNIKNRDRSREYQETEEKEIYDEE